MSLIKEEKLQGKIINKHYQNRLMEEIRNEFQCHDKALLLALCGCGKTIMALQLISEWLELGKRVGISTYDMTDIRKQWVDTIVNFKEFSLLKENLQIVCTKNDVEKYKNLGANAVCGENISTEVLLTIFIPPTITSSVNLGKFDYLVIDEAHENLETQNDNGRLKSIIKCFSNKSTKYLGLSGTGFDLFKEKEKFFYGVNPIIYDLRDGLIDDAINNGKIIAEKFDVDLPAECYGNKELNNKGIAKLRNAGLNNIGKKVLNSKKVFTEKIKQMIKEVKSKTLVVVPRGLNCEGAIANFICDITNNQYAAVVNTSKIKNKDKLLKDETTFRNKKSKTDFMIVVDKCGTGWDFKGLNNVIDLTFTKNPKVLIQRFSRTIRLDVDKPLSKYFYCYDQRVTKDKVDMVLGNAISLMTREGILASKKELRIPKEVSTSKGKRLEFSVDISNIKNFETCTKSTTLSWTLSESLKSEVFERTLNDITAICIFHDKNGKYPSPTATDPEERRLGIKLSSLRQAKKNNKSKIFYPEYQNHANKLGHTDLFKCRNIINLQLTLNNITAICEFYNKNERYPSPTSTDPEERLLGIKLRSLIKAKKNKMYGVFYPEYQNHANKLGHTDLFKEHIQKFYDKKCVLLTVNRQEKTITKTLNVITKICSFYDKNARYPSSISTDPEEKQLGIKLITLRQAKNKKDTQRKFYPEYQKHANKLGHHKLFDKCYNKLNIVKVCEWVNKNNKKPSQISDNPIERRYWFWITKKRKNYTKYELETAKKMGCHNLFEIKKRRDKNGTKSN